MQRLVEILNLLVPFPVLWTEYMNWDLWGLKIKSQDLIFRGLEFKGQESQLTWIRYLGAQVFYLSLLYLDTTIILDVVKFGERKWLPAELITFSDHLTRGTKIEYRELTLLLFVARLIIGKLMKVKRIFLETRWRI